MNTNRRHFFASAIGLLGVPAALAAQEKPPQRVVNDPRFKDSDPHNKFIAMNNALWEYADNFCVEMKYDKNIGMWGSFSGNIYFSPERALP
jgi:hypothetical protein